MSKLGLHYQYIPDWAKKLPQTWAKIIDPPSENPFPGAKVIGRTYLQDGESNALVMLAEAGAEMWFAMFRPHYERASYVHAWEGPNEPPVASPEQRSALNRFTVRWNSLMHAAGLKTVALNCSCSWPHTGTAKDFVAAVAGADYLGLHEYSSPTMQTAVGEMCLHYREVVTELLAAGLSKAPQVIIGECGLDDGKRHGWKTFAKTEAEFLKQLQWYADELEQDAYVVTALVFTAGPIGWDDFDVMETLGRAILALVPKKPVQPPTPPVIVPDPQIVAKAIQAAAWQRLNVPLNTEAAFYKYAVQHGLGRPISEEFDILVAAKTPYRLQLFSEGIVYCEIGKWDQVQHRSYT